jgi:PAS domain S-box-containing protein
MFTTLRAKLFAGFLLILLLLVGLGGYAILSFRQLEEITSAGLEQNSQSILANLTMYESLVRMNAAQLGMLAGEKSDAHTVFEDESSQFYLALDQAKSSVIETDPAVRQNLYVLVQKIDSAWTDYRSHFPVFESLIVHDVPAARKLYEETLSPEFTRLKDINLSVFEQSVEAFRAGKASVIERARNATLGVIVGTLIALMVGIIGSYVIARRTTNPLRTLTDSVKGLQAGHLDTRITVESADEIGDLSFEFNRLAERLREFEAMNINEIVREKLKSEAIIESIDDPLLLFDASGSLTLMNHAAEEITGITESTGMGRPLSQLFRDKKVLKELEHALEEAAASQRNEETAAPAIVSIERKSRQRYFRLHVARIVSKASGQSDAATEIAPTVWILVLFTDITHFKEIDKMKSDFIAKVSHEFRTPLTSMTMALDILHEEMLGHLNVEQHDIVNTSRNDAARLAKLIRDLLLLSRLESARQRLPLTPEGINIGHLTENLLRSLAPLYREKNVDLSSEVSVEPDLRMNEEHLVSIVSNLLSNALKYTPSGGGVHLSIKYDTELSKLTIRVKDTGIGVAAEDQKRIFEKFVQVKPTDSSTPGSVGLGLAIVTEIASRYNGKINLTSAIGEGSTFTVELTVAVDEQPKLVEGKMVEGTLPGTQHSS